MNDYRHTNSLQICQINISGLSSRSITAIDRFNHKFKIDILSLQETLLDSSISHLRILHNLETFSVNNSRGVSTSVSPKLHPQQITELEDTDSDAVWVTVRYNSSIVMVGNIYVNYSITSNNNLSAALANISRALQYCVKFKIKDLIILGDFNSRHMSWGDIVSTERGKQLQSFIGQHDLTCIAPNANTFVSHNGGSIIDLALVKGKMCRLYQSSSIDEETELFTGAPTRGHLPVIHQFVDTSARQLTNIPPLLYWDIDKIDWNAWSGCLSRALQLGIIRNLHSYSDPIQLWLDFKATLSAVNENCIPRKRVCLHSKPFWNSHLSDLSSTLQAAQARMKSCYSPYNVSLHKQAKEKFSEALIFEKNQWIHQKLENLNVTESQQFWKNYKRTLTNKSYEYMGNLMEGGVLHSEASQKESILFNSFFSGEHMNEGDFDQDFEQRIDNHFARIVSDNFSASELDPIIDNHLNGKITPEEISFALKAQKTTVKSFDADELHPRILKHLPPIALKILTKLFNLVLDTGSWVWDVSNVSFIKKDGKDNYMKASAYRPITISSYIGKLLERILEKRIKLHCEVEGLLDDEQEGFRPQRNTARYLYKLVATLDECKKRKLTTFLLCVDFSKAFDSIWVKGLVVKLEKYLIQGKILRVIHNFLHARKVRLKINSHLGYARLCGQFGLPQGSILSPLLFILYVSDMLSRDQLPSECHSNSNLFKYADDGSVAVSHINPIYAHLIMQKMCQYLYVWCSKWKLIPNCDINKTECIIIAPNTSIGNFGHTFVPLKIGRKQINYASQSTVLGLTIDSELTFKNHANFKLRQCWFAWHKITCNSNRYRGLNASSLRMLFKTIVLTKLLYAAPIWLRENLGVYKDFYARVILKISGATHHPPQKITSVALGIPPLELAYKMVTVKFIIKALTSDALMQGLILQLEDSRTHRFYHHIDMTRHFLSWKATSNKISRNRINLLTCIGDGVVNYSKEEMTGFLEHCWGLHNYFDGTISEEAFEFNKISCISKLLLPRHSHRITDTKVISLLHGHDNCFKAFESRVTGNDDPFCSSCSTPDNRHHRTFECPLYNCAYRDALQHHSNSSQPMWSMIAEGNAKVLSAFRCLAQLAMTE